MLEGLKTLDVVLAESAIEGGGRAPLLGTMPLELFCALIGVELGATMLGAPLFGRMSGYGALMACETSLNSCSSGAQSLASTSRSSVK